MLGLLLTLWDDDSPHFELYKRGIGAFAEYTWAGDKKTNDEYKSLFRHRTFGPKWENEKFAFIDSIEGPVGAWVNALVVDKSHRNSLKKNDNAKEELLISLPKANQKGEWTALYSTRIIKAKKYFEQIITNEKNKKKIDLNLKELTIINELTITVGLIMLTIGNFLGGQWANESWGRYWGWDPKETWALISIMIYAFILHMRLIPGLRGKWIFNLMSIIAYASILMTYFGVNFYLSGLHSYASGDKIITPDFVYYSGLFVFVLGFASYFKYKKYFK